MQIDDLLAQIGGTQQMAGKLGLSPQQAQAGAAALLPAILGGFQKRSGGGNDLGGLLSQLGGSGLADNVRGDNILGQIFGSKEVSRAVASQAASRSGVDAAVLKKMLPLLAMLATGYLARQQGSSTQAGGLGAMLGGLLGGGNRGGAGGLAAMLDANGNGNPLDDILGMLGGKPR